MRANSRLTHMQQFSGFRKALLARYHTKDFKLVTIQYNFTVLYAIKAIKAIKAFRAIKAFKTI